MLRASVKIKRPGVWMYVGLSVKKVLYSAEGRACLKLVRTCVFTWIRLQTNKYKLHVYLYIYIYMCVYIYIYIYICTYEAWGGISFSTRVNRLLAALLTSVTLFWWCSVLASESVYRKQAFSNRVFSWLFGTRT